MKRLHTLLWLLLITGAVSFAARPRRQRANTPQTTLRTALADFVARYELSVPSRDAGRIDNLTIHDATRTVSIDLNEKFTFQPWTQERVAAFEDSLRRYLPDNYRRYHLRISSKGVLLHDLVAYGEGSDSPLQRSWHGRQHSVAPWVAQVDLPYETRRGLKNRHISLWASHGRYYSAKEGWRWQRPRLFCTTEDLLSQTFVVPYLMPMLENAGAILFSPRERDWQTHEVIVDNDTPSLRGLYSEQGTHERPWTDAGVGFAQWREVYLNGEQPFAEGSARACATQSRARGACTVTWTPQLPAAGRYAVYVAYTTLPTSIDDAAYTVRHQGMETHFRVNQQMGGGTWVYLGTFDFDAGCSADNAVVLSNVSDSHGHVTADAVRFGGGMGNIARGPAGDEHVSGMPRFLEGARYSAQWYGAPYWAYANKGATNDYAEDINVRSLFTNHLASGTDYIPADTGRHVPIELSLALHTDAGASREGGHIGSLAIYTTDYEEGCLPTGLSRLTSRDLADQLLTQVDHDIRAIYGNWNRRSLYDRNYSETRLPEVPSTILEMLSHQNMLDLWMAHDPTFKFNVARAIYKGVLRYLAAVHDERNSVVQPLPVVSPSAVTDVQHRRIHLAWQPVADPLEPTAKPEQYIVYHAVGNHGFDNGTATRSPRLTIDNAEVGVLHRFRIAAANDGGRSMLSTEVCAYLPSSTASRRRMLIVDAFDRMAGPQPIYTDSVQGFDMDADPGVPVDPMPGYCGRQLVYDASKIGREGADGLGYSSNDLEGTLLAGNSHDWCTRHAIDAIKATQGHIAISSAAAAAIGTDGSISVNDMRMYHLIDVACGLQRDDGYSLIRRKALTPELTRTLSQYASMGGNLLVSGAYIGTDMSSDTERHATRELLKYEAAGALPTPTLGGVAGMGLNFSVQHMPARQSSEMRYPLFPRVDCIAPTADSFCTLVYTPGNYSAGVAYQGRDYCSIALGFPLEAVTDEPTRLRLWQGFIEFLMPQ